MENTSLVYKATWLLALGMAGYASASDTGLPEGTIGWWYYTGTNAPGDYAATPEEACRRTAKNHMGTTLVDMRPYSANSLLVQCKYPSFIQAGGVDWFGLTYLACQSGYHATREGICVKRQEPAVPLACQSGQAGFAQGNPVIVSTGAKVQRETDLVGGVTESLAVTRTYRIFNDASTASSGGATWFFWFDRAFSITRRSATNARPLTIEGSLGDGTDFKFDWNAVAGKYKSSRDQAATLEALDASYEDWLLIQDGRAEHYKRIASGTNDRFVLLSSQAWDGATQHFTYASDSLLLQEVLDDQGRKLDVDWGSNGQVASISGPDGKVLYSYDTPWGDYPSWGTKARLISVEYTDAFGVVLGSRHYHYEDTHNPFLLTGITDENGQRFATYAYDGNRRTVSSEHAGGTYRYSFAYPDDFTRIITDPLGTQRTIGLQYINNLGVATGESQPGGAGCTAGSNAITHDPQGNVTSRTDFNGNMTCYRYDARNLETSRVDGLLNSDGCPASDTAVQPRKTARRTATQWHPDFPLQTIVAEPNRITTYRYNGQPDASGMTAACAPEAVLANGKPVPLLCSVSVQATSDVNGSAGLSALRIGAARVWDYTYDTNGRILQARDPADAEGRRATTTYVYYQDGSATHNAGDLASVTNAAGDVTHYSEYSLAGKPTVIRLANGNTMRLHYGPDQRLSGTVLEDGNGDVERREFGYDLVGNQTRTTDPDGASFTYAYDAAHRLTDVTDNTGNHKHFDLDGFGNVIGEQVYDPQGTLAFKLSRSFDALNRLQREQHALQQTGTNFEYDRNGNLTKWIDPLGRYTTRQYDSFNRVVREQLPTPMSNSSRHLIDYTYDQQGELLTLRDPKGLTTRYTVDGFGQRTALSSPDTGTSSYLFDGAGRLASRTDARGVVTRYGYDPIGRVTRAGVTSPSIRITSYQYGAPDTQAAGQLTGMRDDSGHTEFAYDGFGRLIGKTQTVTGAVTSTFAVRYVYGSDGPGTGHLVSMTYPSGIRIDIAHDDTGRPASLALLAPGTTMPTPLLTEIAYRPMGAVSGWTWGNHTSTSPNRYVRGFDLDGKLVSYPLGHPAHQGVIRTLHYDAADRIAATTHTGNAQASALDQTYSYDDLDRLTSFDGMGTSQRYAYDKNGNRMQVSFGAASYAYTLSATSNRLLATTGPAPARTNTFDAAGNLLDDGVVRYTYNANHQIDSATRAGIMTRYLTNGRGERVFKTSSAGTTYYVYDEQGHLLGEYDAHGKPLQETVYLGDLPVAVIKPGASGPAVYYVYADHLQAPRVLTRAADNQIVWRWDQADPFGMVPPDENPSGLGMFGYDLRFPGQVFDRESNNHYNYFRDYDPQTGRYVQSDPIGLSGGINTYGYVFNGPTNYADPDGLQAALPVPIPAGPAFLPIPVTPSNPSLPSLGQNNDWFKPSPYLPTWSMNGIIPPQDFPNGISWPPKKTPENCYVEVPLPKLPHPQKPDCETIFDVCKKSVQTFTKDYLSKFVGYGGCIASYLICKKILGGGHG
jgi:RHS repeat-associated protein